MLREWIEASFVLSGRAFMFLQVTANGPAGWMFAFAVSGLFQRFAINHNRNDSSKHLRDPECVPDAFRPHKTGQKIGGGHDNDHIAEKGKLQGTACLFRVLP